MEGYSSQQANAKSQALGRSGKYQQEEYLIPIKEGGNHMCASKRHRPCPEGLGGPAVPALLPSSQRHSKLKTQLTAPARSQPPEASLATGTQALQEVPTSPPGSPALPDPPTLGSAP